MAYIRTTQPQQAVPMAPYWLAKGLCFVDWGNGLVWTKEGGYKSITSKVGTKMVGTKMGMAIGYGASAGVATTDIQTEGNHLLSDGPLSIVAFGYALSAGGGGLGRLFQPLGDAGNISAIAMYFIAGALFAFNRMGSATLGQWGVLGAGSPILNRWVTYGVTHNPQGVVNTFPAMYVDGLPRTDTNQPAVPSGTYPTALSYTMTRGNRSTDLARSWDGYLGPLFIFNGLLTPSDHAALNANPWQIGTASHARAYGALVSLPTLGAPLTDTSAGAWTSTAGTLAGAINEAVAMDTDYISVASASTCEMVLDNTAFPGGAIQVLSYRASSVNGSNLTITLKQGATTIMTRTHALTSTITLYTQTLTSGEIALITAGAISVTLTAS